MVNIPPVAHLFVVDIERLHIFAGKLVMFAPNVPEIVDSVPSLDGRFRYVITPPDAINPLLVTLIWNAIQIGETDGEVDGLTWLLVEMPIPKAG